MAVGGCSSMICSKVTCAWKQLATCSTTGSTDSARRDPSSGTRKWSIPCFTCGAIAINLLVIFPQPNHWRRQQDLLVSLFEHRISASHAPHTAALPVHNLITDVAGALRKNMPFG